MKSNGKFVKTKKWLCLFIAAVLVFSMSACAKPASDPTSTPTPSTDEATPVPTETPVTEPDPVTVFAPHEKYAPIDMGGRTFVFSSNWDNIPANTTDPLPENLSMEQRLVMENMLRVEEKYNMKYQYINTPYDLVQEKLTSSVLAGDPFADFVYLSTGQIVVAAKGNEIYDIKEIAPPNADIYNEQIVDQLGTVLGVDYSIRGINVPYGGAFMVYNKDIISKLGVGDPQQLYANGSWTWDKFMEIAIAATDDTDGDGVIDQWGYAGAPLHFAHQWVGSNDGWLFNDIDKTSGIGDPKTLEALDFINRIYNVEKVAYVYNNDINDWGGNVNAFKESNIAMSFVELYMLPASDPRLPYDFGIVPFPVGPSNQTGGPMYLQADVGGIVIPRGVKNPEWYVQIIEETDNWWGDDYSQKSDGTITLIESILTSEADVDLLLKVSTIKSKFDMWAAVPEFPFNQVVTDVLLNGMTPAQAAESSRQIAEDKILSFFND